MAKLVSKTYGDALFEVAVEEARIDEFYEAAKAVEEILQNNEEYGALMNHPKISKEEKADIVEKTFGPYLPKELVGLLTIMVTKGRAEDMLSVMQYFIGLVKAEKKIGIADVTTAVAMSEEQQKKVEERLLATTAYQSFEMHYHVDETLIGGMVIRIGDRVVDSSIKTKLYELTKSLRKVDSFHEFETRRNQFCD